MKLSDVLSHFRYLIRFNLLKILTNFNRMNKNRHQVTSTTSYNRYPIIFSGARSHYKNLTERPKILSFGCSYGHECISLIDYFPNSIIHGTDISYINLKIAQKKHHHPNIKYYKSDKSNLKKFGKYDIIFALSVLCRWEDSKDVNDISGIYSFEKFEGTIGILDSILEINGILIIYNSNFRFKDSSYYIKYQVFQPSEINESGFVSKFDKGNQRIDSTYTEVFFKKIY